MSNFCFRGYKDGVNSLSSDLILKSSEDSQTPNIKNTEGRSTSQSILALFRPPDWNRLRMTASKFLQKLVSRTLSERENFSKGLSSADSFCPFLVCPSISPAIYFSFL